MVDETMTGGVPAGRDAVSRLLAKVSVSALGEAMLLDLARKPVVLGTAWRDRTAVLVFVRHFG